VELYHPGLGPSARRTYWDVFLGSVAVLGCRADQGLRQCYDYQRGPLWDSVKVGHRLVALPRDGDRARGVWV
jgi:hypothetical protein